jgi:hypothetical protein
LTTSRSNRVGSNEPPTHLSMSACSSCLRSFRTSRNSPRMTASHNGSDYPFDLSDLRPLDTKLANACLDYLNYDRLGISDLEKHLPGGGRGVAGVDSGLQHRSDRSRVVAFDRAGKSHHRSGRWTGSFERATGESATGAQIHGPSRTAPSPAPCVPRRRSVRCVSATITERGASTGMM